MADFNKTLINAAAPNPPLDKGFQVATNPQARNISPERAKLILQGFGLNALKESVYSQAIGEPLETGVTRNFDELGNEQMDQLAGDKRRLDFQFGHITFLPHKYKDPYATPANKIIEVPELMLDTVLMDVSRAKVVVKTSVNGKNGTVKEYEGLDDWQVSIRGALVGETLYGYPSEKVRQLRALADARDSVPVGGAFMSQFGINFLLIEEVRFPQKAGYQNVQFFEMECVSDEPVQLRRG